MANRYSQKSQRELRSCDERLVLVFQNVLPHFDHSILKSYRNQTEQNEAYFKGFSQLKWPAGKHNRFPSIALDACPYPWDFKNPDIEKLKFFAGFVLGVGSVLKIRLRWGGDWNQNWSSKDTGFFDGYHFELVLW